MAAPTLLQIARDHLDAYVACSACREMREASTTIARLVTRGCGATPVDELVFRCHCGKRGEAWVYAAGTR
jgi:hypothetical protein